MEESSNFDYSKCNETEKKYLPEGFTGNVYRLSDKWLEVIPSPENPIKILEIGSYHGANLCSLMKTYAINENSEVHCVDPWFDYIGYNEYLNSQPTNYSIFLNNISKLSPSDIQKIYIHRGLSEKIMPQFEDNYFDIIYIDGNHEKRYVLEDTIMSFKKVKPNGWLVFDDLQCPDVSDTLKVFASIYKEFIHEEIRIVNGQLFFKIKSK